MTCPLCKVETACYVAPLNEFANTYFCWHCGFNTTDLMREGDFDFDEIELALPQLYLDLAKVDSEGRKWYPTTINLPDKGTVFVNGSNVHDAQWAGILVRPLTPEEEVKYAKKSIKYVSDPTTLRMFGSSFIDAAEYVGVFNLK